MYKTVDTRASFKYKTTCTSFWYEFIERVSPALYDITVYHRPMVHQATAGTIVLTTQEDNDKVNDDLSKSLFDIVKKVLRYTAVTLNFISKTV